MGSGSGRSHTALLDSRRPGSSSSGHGHMGSRPPSAYGHPSRSIKGKGRATSTAFSASASEDGMGSSSSHSHSNESNTHGSHSHSSSSHSRVRERLSVRGLGDFISKIRGSHPSSTGHDSDGDQTRRPIPVLETTSPVGRVKRVSSFVPELSPAPVVPRPDTAPIPEGEASFGQNQSNLYRTEGHAARLQPPSGLGPLPRWDLTTDPPHFHPSFHPPTDPHDPSSRRPPWTPYELPPTPHSRESEESLHRNDGLLSVSNILPQPTPSDLSQANSSIHASSDLGKALGRTNANRSVTSLVDHVDWSRPFGGWVFNRMHSTATFATTGTDHSVVSISTSATGTPPAQINENPIEGSIRRNS
jgi:hypothetical protein